MIIKIMVISITIGSLSVFANAATYNYYFSNDAQGNVQGSDVADCSAATPCQTLSKAESMIKALPSTDIVNLYFDRGDSWTWDSAAVRKTVNTFSVSSSDPVVHIDAYGTGDLPIFDGMVKDFSTVPIHNTLNGPLKWSRFFEFQRDNCSVSNIEIKRVYGNGIYSKGAHYFTVSSCYIHNFGNAAFSFNGKNGLHDSTFEHSTVHTGQELYRYSKREGWGGGIEFANGGGTGAVYSNHIHHNIVYDIYGEGIICSNAITEYNIVGDTGSIGIDPAPFWYDSLDTTVRYNLVIFSNRRTSIYDSFDGSSATGIRVFDEQPGGDNSDAVIEIHDNIIINRERGIWFFHPDYDDNAFGVVKIYNNIVIDSAKINYNFSQADTAIVGYFHDNSSILYDNMSGVHIRDNNEFPQSNWKITSNHFWTTGSSPTVDINWRVDYNTSDPGLLGESSIDWVKQIGPTYYKNINPVMHLNPPSGSPIFDLTPMLHMDINTIIKPFAEAGKLSAPSNFQPTIAK